MRIPVLRYDSARIEGNDYATNDLRALASDLRQATAAGFRIVPLASVVDAWLGNRGGELDGKVVALTCDHGTDFSFADLPHPGAGKQRSVLNTLRDFAAESRGAQRDLNITAFVVASAEARAALDAACMIGKGWWSDGWWPEAVTSRLMHLGNNSWDLNHEALPPALRRAVPAGTFASVDSRELGDHEIRAAADTLRSRAPNPGTTLFAYPYGESNPYLVRGYFPEFGEELGIRAAFTANAGFLETGTGRWEVPRFVCGRDWTSPEELAAILDAAANRRRWVAVRAASVRATAAPAPDARPGRIDGLRGFSHFVATHVEPIPGWLHPEAALLTAHLARAQAAIGIAGPTLEIGVYKGKYLSVLYKLAQLAQPAEQVVGIDLFVGSINTRKEVALVTENVARACGEADRLKIVVADSMDLTAERVAAEAGGEKLRWVSIDGGHTRELVLRDLETAYPVLHEGGIMALDDVFNFGTPGVSEGVAEFFLTRKPALAPFALCYNKVFVTTPPFHARYLAQARKFLDVATWLPMHERTRRNLRDNRQSAFTPELFGYEVLPFL